MRTLVAVLIPALLVFATPAAAQQKKKAGSRTAPVWAVNHEVAAPEPAPAPAVTLAPPVTHDSPACHGGQCGKKHGHKKGCCLLDWFCYRRSFGCVKCDKGCGCCYYCHPPLYSYFGCDCREGAKHGTVEPKPCPPPCSGCGWNKGWATGPRMFAHPTGHGVCNVR